jgi:heavy metal translocating P-type ATPase
VPHGASPPADGLVAREGAFRFDESSLTGESMPVGKSVGDKVYSGSINVGPPVYVEISEIGSGSMLDQIVAVVREGQTKRAPVERVADIMTGYFVPVITLVAIITFVVWFGLGQSGALPEHYKDRSTGGWAFWSLQFAIAVFVVSCPCGLALAAPTALFVGGGLAAKRGILVKGGGEAFQEASRLDAIVFDKTGTLTEGGSLKVSDHELLVTDKKQQMVAWALARALEESSTHPIARAIAEFCSAQDSYSIIASSVSEIPGQGMKGTFTVSTSHSNPDDGSTHVQYEAGIGNLRMLETLSGSRAVTFYLSSLLSRYQSNGKSTAIFALRELSEVSPSQPRTSIPAIVFATSDPVRSEAAGVISQLQSKNIDVYMCTGDNRMTAYAVASAIGIPKSNVVANVLPNQKAEFIKQLQDGTTHSRTGKTRGKNYRKTIVAFVGDGTNDSPALTAADVSIAMASGSDVAVGSAGFILLKSELSTILELCTLSRRVFRRVKWNFGWAAVYNMLLVPVAAGVLYPIVIGKHVDDDGVLTPDHWRLDPVWASLAMALSSLSVVGSSLALKIEWRDVARRLGFRRKKQSKKLSEGSRFYPGDRQG